MHLAPYAKAVVAFCASLITALLAVLTGDETFADLNTVEWLTVAGSVLATTGLVYGVPNADQS